MEEQKKSVETQTENQTEQQQTEEKTQEQPKERLAFAEMSRKLSDKNSEVKELREEIERLKAADKKSNPELPPDFDDDDKYTRLEQKINEIKQQQLSELAEKAVSKLYNEGFNSQDIQTFLNDHPEFKQNPKGFYRAFKSQDSVIEKRIELGIQKRLEKLSGTYVSVNSKLTPHISKTMDPTEFAKKMIIGNSNRLKLKK